MPRRWLFKTEPSDYSFDDLEREKKVVWDGVSNNLALKNLRDVRMGDEILIYHTGNDKAIVGLAEAISDPYPDPSESDDHLMVIKLKPKRRFSRQVTLSEIKNHEAMREFDLIRLPRLSIMPIKEDIWSSLQEII